MAKKKIFVIILLTSLFLPGCTIMKGTNQDTLNYMQPVTLNVWGVWDTSDDFKTFIETYKAIYPYVTVQYRRFRYDEYEKALIEAFATDRGPDIFAVHNSWVEKYHSQGLITPLPEKITMARPVVSGTFKKEVIQQKETKNSLTVAELKKRFIDVVYHDAVAKDKIDDSGKMAEKIYGLPLSVDTLAMFYNKDLFNNAGITSPPTYWDNDFQQYTKKLTKQDNKGQIIQSGVALGGSSNIERSTDILSVLMMQSGSAMMRDGIARFNEAPNSTKKDFAPGTEALRFYTDFANPAKEVYCWNEQMPNSPDLFAQGKLAMLFGYSYMIPTIKANGPKINFAISNFPQIKDNPTVNFANYWLYSVSKKILTNPDNLQKGSAYAKQKQAVAWNFIQFISDENQVKNYLEKTKRPTALRSLVNSQKENEELSVFADQLLTAKSWYEGKDPNATETFIKEMIDSVVAGKISYDEAVNRATKKITQIEKQN
ncbi:MAG: Cyclodextrin-binding protein precursor [Parcubacteria group bacterium ADurb.Bin316]|nr:MAG: Cyclodextrin-binding protein precursor [Parcubacteria group bacterium ADurb.Bin316]HOZ55739.1 extracellular solute-binding protein [bacterium]